LTRRRVVVLGSTGSIGTQTLEVLRAHADRFEIVGLSAGSDGDGLARQADACRVTRVALGDRDAARSLAAKRPDLEILDGPEGVTTLAGSDADLCLNGITGAIGLQPTLAALGAGTPVALANKESLIVGGDLVVTAAEKAGGKDTHLLPVDSEHSALLQCLRGGRRDEVARLVLTASGGPFRGWDLERLQHVTPAEALAHPTWRMGPVITINSATLMNKGLELIETHLLFDCPWDRLDVVVHPQSVVHSLVQFVDGSSLAQLSPPDMRLPIQVALSWPERLHEAFTACDWTTPQSLTFEPVDRASFRALDLAEEAGRRGGTYPGVMNAAIVGAGDAFRAGTTAFLTIAAIVEATMEAWDRTGPGTPTDIDEVLTADTWARAHAARLLTGEGIG
jgi:1-deoxy-D-xylulose-5-phosphate reductoisomerase